MKVERDFAARYGDLTAWHWWFRARARILSTVLARELGPATAPRLVASLGSGPPSGLSWIVPHAGEGGLVVGVDADPTGALRSESPRAPAHTAFAFAAAERPALREHAFDAVLCLDVIEHLDDDAGALAAAARLVKPGGLLLVTVPAGPSLWGQQDVVTGHKRRYTRRSLAGAFARASLARPRLAPFNTILFPPIAAMRWTRRVIGGGDPQSDFDENRPGLVNDLLAAVFASERHVVGRVPLPFGVSLLACLRP